MKLKKLLGLSTLIALLTLTSPIQAVTAADLTNHDELETKTKTEQHLPNDGASDLQALIQRVANDDTEQSETKSKEAATDTQEPEIPEPEIPAVETAPDEKPVEKPAEKPVAKIGAQALITGKNGTCDWSFNSDTGTLTFQPGQLAQTLEANLGGQVTLSNIKKVVFDGTEGNTVEAPANANNLFAYLTMVEDWEGMSNFSTSQTVNMGYMFRNAGNGGTIDVSHFDTQKVQFLTCMFYNAGFNHVLGVDQWNTENVMNMTSMFAYSDIETLNLDNLNVSKVLFFSRIFDQTSKLAKLSCANWQFNQSADVIYMFSDSALKTFDASSWNVQQLTNFSCMFGSWRECERLDVTNFNTDNATNMEGMFMDTGTYCKLNLIGVESFNTSSVTNMKYTFAGCGYHGKLDLSSWNVNLVTSFLDMFADYGADKDKTFELDLTNWRRFSTTNNVNMQGMFLNNERLVKIDFTNFNTTGVTIMYKMFAGAKKLVTLDLSSFDTNDLSTNLVLDPYGNGTEGSFLMFQGTNLLRKITLGVNAKFNNQRGTFLNMTPVKYSRVEIDGKTYEVTANQWQIRGDGTDIAPTGDLVTEAQMQENTATPVTYVWPLTDQLTLTKTGVNGTSPWELDTVTGELLFKQDETFGNGTQLHEDIYSNVQKYGVDISEVKSIKFESSIKAPQDVVGLFAQLVNCETIDLAHLDTTETTDMSMMFAITPKLTNLKNITALNTSNVTAMIGMFAVTGLKTIDLSHFNTAKVTDMTQMFWSLYEPSPFYLDDNEVWINPNPLETLNLGGSFTINEGTRVAEMFTYNANLWQVTLGEHVTFGDDPEFPTAPTVGTTIPGTNYQTTAASWQAVGEGKVHQPQGSEVSTTEMWQNATPETYVWAHYVITMPSILSVNNMIFGTKAISDFVGTMPKATNMGTGKVSLADLDGDYTVSVSQTSGWRLNDQSEDDIDAENLTIMYGGESLADNTVTFKAGNSQASQLNIGFDHDSDKDFELWLSPTLDMSAVLGQQLKSEVTWTLSDVPE